MVSRQQFFSQLNGIRLGLLIITLIAVVWAILEFTRKPYSGQSGFTEASAYSDIRKSDIRFHIWYPAQPDGRAITVGGNGVFHSTPAGRDATHVKQAYPTVFMSHGAGGNAGQFGWIARSLAEAGFVVVLPNHPGTTSRNASAEAAVRVWERPQDISTVIDEIIEHPDLYSYVDVSQPAVLGFSAGGYTAMAISGARVDPERLTRFCDRGSRGMSDCDFLARHGIDLHSIDLQPAAQDLRDNRIKAAVVVDPGIVETLTTSSLELINIPMLVINLGEESLVPLGVYARPAAELIPGAKYELVGGATHFSFLAQCTERGAAILKKEGEADLLCDDAGRAREDIHRELSAMITEYLVRTFSD